MLPPVIAVSFAETEWLPWVASDRRPNLLVRCTGGGLELVVTRLMNWCRAPLLVRRVPGGLDLPEELTGTLVVWDVAQLTLRQQIELYDWMSHLRQSPQVICLTSEPLLPLVERGQFLEGLLCRINVVSLRTRTRRYGCDRD